MLFALKQLILPALIISQCAVMLAHAKPSYSRVAEAGNAVESCNMRMSTDQLNECNIAELNAYRKIDADACTDFHAYACGNYRSEGTNLGSRLLNEKMVQIFTDFDFRRNNDSMLQKLRHYFVACTSRRENGKVNVAEYVKFLPSPLQRHWLSYLAMIGRYGYQGHFVSVMNYPYNTTEEIFAISQHDLATPTNFTRELFDAFKTHGWTTWEYETLVTRFEKLESHLQSITANNSVSTRKKLRIADLNLKSKSNATLHSYLRMRFGDCADPNALIDIINEQHIIAIIDYLDKLNSHLLNLYTLVRFVNFLEQLPQTPFKESSVSAAYCMQHMRKTLFLPTNYAYEQYVFAAQRAEVEEIVQGIFAGLKQQFFSILEKNAMRLDIELLLGLHRKLAAMRLNVGNMPTKATQAFYDDYVDSLRVGSNFYGNHLNALLFAHKCIKGHDSALWLTFNPQPPTFPDAFALLPYYDPHHNRIVLPFSYLQLPFFNTRFSAPLLYGDIGALIGHELTHSFDPLLIDYDEAGNLQNYSDLLTQNSAYMKDFNCIKSANASAINEIICDLVGMELALREFKRRYHPAQDEFKLLFLKFAQFFCSNESDDFHDSGSFRLNYVVAQLTEFAEAFKCPANSTTNPTKKCKLWY